MSDTVRHMPLRGPRRLTEADFDAAEREADRVVTFCLSGLGHQNVEVIEPEPEVGQVGWWQCEDCGTSGPLKP